MCLVFGWGSEERKGVCMGDVRGAHWVSFVTEKRIQTPPASRRRAQHPYCAQSSASSLRFIHTKLALGQRSVSASKTHVSHVSNFCSSDAFAVHPPANLPNKVFDEHGGAQKHYDAHGARVSKRMPALEYIRSWNPEIVPMDQPRRIDTTGVGGGRYPTMGRLLQDTDTKCSVFFACLDRCNARFPSARVSCYVFLK